MRKEILIFDSDALIKLAKSQALKKILQGYSCSITEQVYGEAVEEGQRKLYEDAFLIAEFVELKLLKVEGIKEMQKVAQLGKGELSTLALFKKLKKGIREMIIRRQ